ncbi:MAG: peptidylprolyl isomerase [Ignavibacteriae bacterium]|nr:MAG: peptidylprolyl isomerase [Ignavibacteriota bacterium]
MKLFNISILIAAFLAVGIFVSGCGKKEEVPPKTTTTQEQNKTQDNQQKTTQQQDTNKTIAPDTSKTTEKESKTETNKVVIQTSMGDITVELFEKDAPKHVANFKKLVKSGFYNNTTFHRVIAGFMIQGGDPNSKDDDRSNDGQGGPGYTIPAEIKAKHVQGALAGARLGDQVNPKKESSGSQFYIVTGNASHLDGEYTVYGKVIKGMDIALKIEKVGVDRASNPVEKVVIKKVYFVK